MRNFRTYDLAVSFYRAIKTVHLPAHLKNQLQRASSSIALNVSEGNGRSSRAERKHYFNIAMGSLRESQAVIQLEPDLCKPIAPIADQLGALLYCLVKSMDR